MILLETAWDEKIYFFQPILSITKLDGKKDDMYFGYYHKVLSIRFIGSNENVYIIDNEQNRATLSENGYSLTN